MHVVMVGGAVAGIGAAVAATMTYRSGTKELVEEGINPATRLRIIPIAAKTLALSMVLTGLLGTAGFYIMKEQGFFKTDRAELLSAQETVKLLRDPRGYIKEQLKKEQQPAAGEKPG